MLKRPRQLSIWLWRGFLALVIALLIATLPNTGGLFSKSKSVVLETKIPDAYPIQEQLFYSDLQKVSSNWNDIVIGQVEGDNPKTTLLNFYAVMSSVGQQAKLLEGKLEAQPGLLASTEIKEQITDVNMLFRLAVQSLDASYFPESVRNDMSEEAAIQLKHILDFVFTHSNQMIDIPDYLGMVGRYKSDPSSVHSWRIPGTAITLVEGLSDDPTNNNYYFSADTVQDIQKMYEEVSVQPVVSQPYATPDFYKKYITTPGYLVPPKWYLKMPEGLRNAIEYKIKDQTIFQIASTLIVFFVYAQVVIWLLTKLISTYKKQIIQEKSNCNSLQANIVWSRVVYITPILLLTVLAHDIVDDVINFTGVPLIIASFLFKIIEYLCLSVFSYYFLEALGRSGAEFLTKLRGGQSNLQLQRISNLIIPLCRAGGVLVSVVLIYRLLLVLGLPANTVLAFSAVPGLAIGLGASKLLGNLFAGLSIQTDRPLRVGEFCQIGDNLGFVTKIGLRSLELKTLESIVKIPNSAADEATIVNFSRHDDDSSEYPRQGIELSCHLPYKFSPFQLNELLRQCRLLLENIHDLYKFNVDDAIVSFGKSSVAGQLLTLFVLTEIEDWNSYLALREFLFIKLEELIGRVDRCTMIIKVAYSTTSDQLALLPQLLRSALCIDPCMEFVSCELIQISDFSYDYQIELSSHHQSQFEFDQAMHQFNQRVLKTLAENGIKIPFPSQTLRIDGLGALSQASDQAQEVQDPD